MAIIDDAAGQLAQYLSFVLDGESFALEIGKVREVLEFAGVTEVPQMPAFVRGVINLRGRVVPVVDLKQKFGRGLTASAPGTCTIITEVQVDGEPVVLGALADQVQEVVELRGSDIEPPPRIGTWLPSEFILGMGIRNDGFLILLDIDKVFVADELEIVAGAVS